MTIEKLIACMGGATSIVIACVFASLLSGCAIPLQPEASRDLGSKHVFVKNYDLGQKKTVNVGDAMVKLQDYWVVTKELAVAVPTGTVTLTGGPINIILNAGSKYPIRGRMVVDGIEYIVVQSATGHGVLVKSDGTIHTRVAGWTGNGYVLVIFPQVVSDPSVKLVREVDQSINAQAGYKNFQLLYTGKNATGLNLTYREFSPEGMARVAFFQNLTYERSATSITFKDYKIVVHDTTSDSITFSVLSDGLTGGAN